MTYTARDIESAKDVLLTGDIQYWCRAKLLEDGSLYLVEDDEDAKPITITPTALLDWLTGITGPAALLKEVGNRYHRAALAGLMVLDWDNLDYDADTADLITQWIALGEIRYG